MQKLALAARLHFSRQANEGITGQADKTQRQRIPGQLVDLIANHHFLHHHAHGEQKHAQCQIAECGNAQCSVGIVPRGLVFR